MAYAAYIPEANRKDKLGKKAEKLRFVGYSLHTKGYRLISDDTVNIVVHLGVIFYESDFPYDSTTCTVDIDVGITCKKDEVVVQEIPEEVEWPAQGPEEVQSEQEGVEQQEQEGAEQNCWLSQKNENCTNQVWNMMWHLEQLSKRLFG